MLSELIGGRYRVEREIGRGGMGIVLRAFDVRLSRAVALKMLPPDAAHDFEQRRRLAAEAHAASAFSHAGIATVYDFVEQDGESFIVYEYVDGCTLRKELAQARFTAEEIFDAGVQLADALVSAHGHGITHRDLKPENIMFVPDDYSRGRLKILDFGLAKHVHKLLPGGEANTASTASIWTTPGLLVGTVTYMAPEQLESQPTDARTDIYALGLVLYEMATGANPFLGRTPPSTIANILKQEAPPIRQCNPTAPAELDRILQKCLRKRPEERYQSARELLADLRNFRRNSTDSPTTSQAGEIQPSLLYRFFLLSGASPYRRWETMNLGMILWFVLLGYFGLRFWRATVYGWGWILFLIELACIGLLVTLLSYLVYTGTFDRRSLPREIGRTAAWIRWSTVALLLATWAMAGTVMVSHPGLAALLAICGIGGSLKYLLFKPVIDRAAFPGRE